jgi:hypothetical protein
MQATEGKDAEIGDVVRDAAGIAVFLGIAAALQHQCASWMRRISVLTGIGVMISIFSPPLLTASAIASRWHKFPVIADFGSPLSIRLCSATNAQFLRVCVRTGFAALVKFNRKAPSSAFAVNGPFPDWSNYKNLAFRVGSPLSAPITLNLRIHDAQHNNDYGDRYNAEVQIKPGRNEIKIPLHAIEQAPAKRRMDMNSIRSIVLFVVRPEEDFELTIDEFRLEEKT